ncbi:MAG: asparagine synthase (glutamine-hydrolyzing) [Cryomorphaceae bacterium]|nr:MAG: asparagine synthase (glutamine-hydrolyzing) [Cryomorphaceae bacterium]
MCGIAGYVSREKLNGPAMVAAMAHRGPDGEGFFEEQCKDFHLFLGHRRLAILDLSERGKQPMTSADGNAVICFNGEIYNHHLLKSKLASGWQPRSSTDTEVLLELLNTHGIRALEHLNGDFAFAFFNREENALYLVRDRLGVKPLYYHFQDNVLRFGSEIKAILAGEVRAALNKDELGNYFIFKYVPRQETLFKGVKRLEPGCYLRFDLERGTLETHRYWKPQTLDVPKTYAERRDHVRSLLTDAVELRLGSDVPVSTFLSGGLDSSIIASLLRNRPEIRHYCAVKDERDVKAEGTTSDAHYARELAREWKLSFEAIAIGSDELTTDLLHQTLRFSDDLIADGSQIPAYLITAKASQKSTVVLSGMGADELFFGYGGHIILRMAGMLDKLPAPIARMLARRMAGLYPGRGKGKAVKRYLYKLGRYYGHPHRFAPLSVVGDWHASSSVYQPFSQPASVDFLGDYAGDDFEALQHFERENFLVKNLHYLDRMSMAHAMESRVPFLDHRLAEFAWSLPVSDRIAGLDNTKRILKDAFQSDLPRDIVRRRKAGFGMPLRTLLSSQEILNKLLDPAFFGNFEGFSVDRIQGVVKDHRRGTADHSSILYALISFQHWYRMYIEN